jgi:ATP-binding cassette, subfamily B, bacterial
MLKRFIAYYRPHRRLFILDMLASLAVSMVGILYPVITRYMLNELIPEKRYRTIILCGSGLLLLYIVRMLLNYFIQYYGHVMGVRMQAQMRSDMFRHLERLPYSFYDNHETGKIMSRMTNDLQDISELAHHGPENVIISTVSVIVSFAYLCTINWKLTLTIFICVPFLLAAALLLRRKMRDAFKKSRVSIAQINAALESSISGIRVTKAFTNQAKEEEKFEEGNRSYIKARSEAYHAMGQFHSATSFITDVFNVIVLVAGGLILFGAFGGEIMQLGDYTAFVTSVSLVITPVMTLINFMEQYQTGVTGFERFVEIMDEPTEQDAPGASPIGQVQGHIEFRDLTYGYEDGKPVLDHINLDIRPGETFALVGPSGGGKTTICHLIPHFYDYSAGGIYIDGRELHTITADSLRRNIGIVQQDIYLFNASIRDNILYGKLDATQEEVEEAARRANIHDYIMTLENGYDTVIGERGVRLSGGQKQRLSIARVFLKNPPILILDEATSALDNTTEILIQQALDELCRGRTTIVVAHRLSTVKNADEIAVIADGRVRELGSHGELMELNGMYRELYDLQFRADSGCR